MTIKKSEQPNISVSNRRDVAYLNGNSKTEGSRRISIDSNKKIPKVEKLVEGIWQPTSWKVGPKTVWIGERVGIAAAGHHIMTEDSDGHFHFHSHAKFDPNTGLSTSDARILFAYQHTVRDVIQPDNTVEFSGTSYDFVFPNVNHTLVSSAYFQTGTTAASEPVRIRVWEGADDTSPLNFDQSYAASRFPALTEVKEDTDGYLEFNANQTYFVRIESTATISLKTNAAGTLPWFATDNSNVREDDMLQTNEWISGSNVDRTQNSIQNRRIYSANETGIQTGTFQDNIRTWNEVSPFIFSWEKLPPNQNTFIPENHQMSVFGTFEMVGDLLLEGSIIIRN